MIVPYKTDPSAVVIPRWVQLGSVWITHHPVEDPEVGLAHLSYAGALEVAAAAGARLPTREEVLELHEAAAAAGTEIGPVILPLPDMRAAGCVPGDPRMVTREWAERHDGIVLPAIAALADQESAVANAGKHWIGPSPRGRAALCGWWVERVELFGSSRHGPGFIQEGGGFPHDDQHHDMATTTLLVRDTAP